MSFTHDEFYSQYADPRWTAKAMDIKKRDGFQCRICGNSRRLLHAHHLCYLPGKKLWEHPDSLIITACGICHKDEHTPIPATLDGQSYHPGPEAVLECSDCGVKMLVEDVSGRRGKHEVMCERCCMRAEEARFP